MERAERAYAKLNLSLDVVGRLDTGYHDMKMVMETVALCDDLRISVTAGQGVHVQTNLPYLPTDDRNIAVKAARLFFRELDLPERRVDISIRKRIPVCAGMAGGSANAAAVLRGLNALLGAGLSRGALEQLGEQLGSDVPYCVAGGTALAQGRGERLTPLPPLPRCHIVICKPPFAVSTPALFARLDCKKIRNRPDTEGILSVLERRDLSQVAHRMYNVFEDVLEERQKEIAAIKDTMLDHSALGAAMTGTGPSVFALFDRADQAEAAYSRLKKSYAETFLTTNRPDLQV